MHDGDDTERLEYEKRQVEMEELCVRIEANEQLTNEEINFFLKEIYDYLVYEIIHSKKYLKEERHEYSMEMLRYFFRKNKSVYANAHYQTNQMAREHLDTYKNLIITMRNDFREAIRSPKNSTLALLVKERELLREYSYCRKIFTGTILKHLKDNCFGNDQFIPVSSDKLARLGEIQEDILVLRKVC